MVIVAVALAVLLAGCGGSVAQQATPAPTNPPAPSATSAPTATATAPPTATSAPAVSLACPTTTGGSTTTFSDSQLGLSFTFPTSWTERDCQRLNADTMVIGNLFIVSRAPRNGQTLQQMVNAAKSMEENVALAPLNDAHAVAADEVSVTFPGGQTSPNEPFIQTLALVAGSQSFYTVTGLIAQMNVTDTIPNISRDQLARQVVATFHVP
jgi:hypothetical protein